MGKNESETIAMILDDEGLGLQLGNKENILRLNFDEKVKGEPEPFSTVAIQKNKAVLWHVKGIEQKVKMARKQGPEVANSTYLEALRTVIEFARPLTLEEACSITGWIPKTVSNRISEIKKGKQRQGYRGVPYFKRGGGPLFRIEDILRYMGAFEPDPLHREVLDQLAPQGKDAKE